MVEIINNGGPKINHPKVCDLLKQIYMFVRKGQRIHYPLRFPKDFFGKSSNDFILYFCQQCNIANVIKLIL